MKDIRINVTRFLLVGLLTVIALGLPVILKNVYHDALAKQQSQCSITVKSGESIQSAINKASKNQVICLEKGIWEENLRIDKPLTLQGVPEGETVIRAREVIYPAILVTGTEKSEILPDIPVQPLDEPGLWFPRSQEKTAMSVKITGLKITGPDEESVNSPEDITSSGIYIGGSVRVLLRDSTITNT